MIVPERASLRQTASSREIEETISSCLTSITKSVATICLILVVIVIGIREIFLGVRVEPVRAHVIETDILNVRAGPWVRCDKIGELPFNAPLILTGRNEESTWVRMVYKDLVGWVSVAYIATDAALEDLPINEGNYTQLRCFTPNRPEVPGE